MTGDTTILPEWARALAETSKTIAVEKAPPATPEEIERARHDPEAFLELVLRRDPRPTPPAGAVTRAWERFCQRQDALKLADLKGAIEAFRNQRVPRFDDPEVQAAIRQRIALDETVAHLARFIRPTEEELGRLRQELLNEVRAFAQISGHTFESALERMADLMRGVVVARPETPWEDLRDHLRQLGPQPRPEAPVFVGVDRAFEPPVQKRQRPRNKYDHRPPGKR